MDEGCILATTRDELQATPLENESRIPGSVAFRRAHEGWQRGLAEAASSQGLNDEALLVTAGVAERLSATMAVLNHIREST